MYIIITIIIVIIKYEFCVVTVKCAESGGKSITDFGFSSLKSDTINSNKLPVSLAKL